MKKRENSRWGLVSMLWMVVVLASNTFTACNKDEDGQVTLKVNSEQYYGIGKAYVDEDLFTCWSNGDAVRINGEEKNIVISTVNNQTSCYIYNVNPAESYWSIFPSSVASGASYASSGTINGIVLPASQPYTVYDGKQMVPTVMTAYLGSTTGTISYHNACIALQLTLTNNYSRDLLLNDVRVSTSHAPLNGSFSITGVDGNEPTLVWASGNTVAEANKRMELTFGSDGLSLPSGQEVTLFVILPPTDNYPDNKFTIGVTATDGADNSNGVTVYEFSHTQSSSANGAFERNKLVPIHIMLNDPHTLVLKGLGTTANPYHIYTPEDLQSMQHLVAMGYEPIGNGTAFASAYYQLMNDISLAEALSGPIGTASSNFTGHFDGQGHTLSNLSVNAGLFGYISEGATIQNLTVDGATISMAETAVGGVICAMASKAVVDHCQVTGVVSFANMPASAAYVGGIVGNAVSTTTGTTQVSNCHNGAQLSVQGSTAAHRVGGIVGRLLNSSVYNSYTMLNTTTANAYVISAANACVGGIVGRMDGDAYVVNCYYGLYDNISGTAGCYADICGEIGSDARVQQSYYRDGIFAKGDLDANNMTGVYPYAGQQYQIGSGSLVGTLLNATARAIGMATWTVPSTAAQAPTLTY